MTLYQLCRIAQAWAQVRLGSPIAEGGYRTVYSVSRFTVLKVPIGEWGMYCNEGEAQAFREDETGRLARCRLIVNPVLGVPMLLMERVEVDIPRDRLPEWADWIDCAQVGLSRTGRFVAYDYVNPPCGRYGIPMEVRE